MKKLIPALCMLLVAASLLGTSTFAWFSMNDRVTAEGMQVTAVSDAIFLEIKGTADSDFSTTGNAALNANLYPAHHEAWTKVADIADFDLDDDLTDDNWYYRYSGATDDADASMTPKKYIDAFGQYVATATYDIQLRDGSASTAYDLYVSNITIPANTGITVVIAGDTGYQEFSASASDIVFSSANVLFDTISTTEKTLTVYIYINGDDANVYTDNAAALTGSVSFTVDAFVADHVAP